MAKKIVFIALEDSFHEEIVDYEFFPGFAPIQKKKNVKSLEDAIHTKHPGYRVLEVSTKSNNELGVALSAFNLKLDGLSIESIFQSSKVFLDGIQFDFLIDYQPREAKKYIKEHAKVPLKCFRYKGQEYPLSPASAFYDYIYIKALLQNTTLSNQLINYDAFTDVEFNFNKSINCQARTCSIFSHLMKSGKLNEFISSFDKFITLYKESGLSLA